MKKILQDLGLNFYEAGGVYAISRDSMCKVMPGNTEQEHYDNTLARLKGKTGHRLFWASKCDDYLYLDRLDKPKKE